MKSNLYPTAPTMAGQFSTMCLTTSSGADHHLSRRFCSSRSSRINHIFPSSPTTGISSLANLDQAGNFYPSPTTTFPLHTSPLLLLASSTRGGGSSPPPPGFLRRTFPSFPWSRLPNLLTYARCLAIPLLIALFYATPNPKLPPKPILLSFLFAIASFTDWLDGYLARRWHVSTPFGAFLDPVADKLMVSTALILISGKYGPSVAIPTSIILAREIAVSALREWMAQRGLRDVVKVGFQGKVKTAATMIAITVLLACEGKSSGWLFTGGLGMLYLCTVVTVTSGSVYFKAAAPILLGGEEETKEETQTKKDEVEVVQETAPISIVEKNETKKEEGDMLKEE